MRAETHILGIDVGGTGIKGAPVDVSEGRLLTERYKVLTPQPPTPEAVAETLTEVVRYFDWDGPLGVGFPAVVKNGLALSAANIDKSWIGKNIESLFERATGLPVKAINDADAAGIAEIHFGEGNEKSGSVILITIGSGLGSALFTDGHLVRNTEFGHFFLEGQVAERYASNRTREREELSWQEWGHRFNKYLHHLNRILSPDRIILGGGASKAFHQFSDYLDVPVVVRPARHLNGAGTIGAACHAYWSMRKKEQHGSL